MTASDQLVRAAAGGDERAWSELVERYTPLLRRTAKGFRLDAYEIDDVVQSCWLALFESLPALRDTSAVGAWLATAARRQSMRARQRETREVLSGEPLGDELPAPESTEEAVFARERISEVRNAVRRLPGRQRELLQTLIAEPDRSYAEMSRSLAMPIGSIGPTRERALNRLRQDERLARAAAR